MLPIETFSTERLIAERLCARHLEELCRLHQDPRVMATLGGLRSAEETKAHLEKSLTHWARHGFGLWALRDKAEGRFVGRAGLRHVFVGGGEEVELAYALAAEAWGRGLATEIARALLRLAFERLDLTEVVAFTLPTNLASRRVMEKVGFTFERDIVHAGLPHGLYRITGAGQG